jgi:glucokinase
MSFSARYALGIDMGGTKIAFVVVDAGGNIYHHAKIDTSPERGVDDVVKRIAHEINRISQSFAIIGIGIGCPGYVDRERGMVVFAANLEWHNVPLKKLLERQLMETYPMYIMNDVDALLLGELQFGTVKGANNAVYLALGTGLGASAISDGKLIVGARYAGMELGHLTIANNRRRCACGKQGCLETSLSGKGMLAAFNEYKSIYTDSLLNRADSVSTYDIITAMQTKDTLAQIIRQELIANLTQALLICQAVLDPDQYIIGGGLGHALSPYILKDIRKNFRDSLALDVAPQIHMAALHESAIGATVPVWNNHQDHPKSLIS